MTPFHAKFWAYELTRRAPADSVDRLATALVDAQVDLNPHQIDAALFAFRSPLSKGVLLADEVGLGKTIEAGLVISQKWAERRRRLLVVTPSNLRKQWHQELSEKFFLPCSILESKPYNGDIKQGRFRPFERDAIVICSYQFARNKAADISAVPWDLVVMDEAHRLRNVYKPGNVIANTLKQSLAHAPKLLLTATPLQNSLLELFGLVSILDEQVFGDLRSFREQYLREHDAEVFRILKNRLKPVCQRTLRRQVTAYISYTRRLPLVEHFTPAEGEDHLYYAVSDYLCRDNLLALPASQRALMTLVLRKLLASSTFAIAGALQTLINRLSARLRTNEPAEPLSEELERDYEALAEVEDEPEDHGEPPLSDSDRAALQREIAELEEFRKLATSITHNAKGEALLKALHIGMGKAVELGAAEKAIIFTESRKTQDYLLRVLADSPWKDGVVLFNGSNTDERSKAIYADWKGRHEGTDRISGSRTADMRSALVDYFRERGQIMIATEAGAEGINLQFCSLVVNYDLPWNPQRIEQRIGRCHRYGQKHDVVVLNFLNRNNAADQRVYQLLSEKFQLFEGVFGASDEVLGAIESGVDLEKRIAGIYQTCRRPDEIKQAFDQLQLELNFEITETLTAARQQLLENFDDEVREKLRVRDAASKASLGRYERLLMELTRFELRDHARFVDDGSFELQRVPDGTVDVLLGRYELPRRTGHAHFYRLNHPLAEAIVRQARSRALAGGDPIDVEFDLTNYQGKISAVEPLRGQGGWLRVTAVSIESMDQAEDHLLVAATTDDGKPIEEDAARRLFNLPAVTGAHLPLGGDMAALERISAGQQTRIQDRIAANNVELFEAEAEKLDGWADDLKLGLEREIKELDKTIKEWRMTKTRAVALESKLAAEKAQKEFERIRSEKRRTLFDAQDEIDRKRGELIAQVEDKLTQKVTTESLFTIRWRVV